MPSNCLSKLEHRFHSPAHQSGIKSVHKNRLTQILSPANQARHTAVSQSSSLYKGLPVHSRGSRVRPSSSNSQDSPSVAAAQAAEWNSESAWKFLKEFTKSGVRGMASSYVASPQKRAALRSALLVAYTSPFPAVGWAPSKRQVAAALAASGLTQEAASKEADDGTEPSAALDSASVDQEVMFGIMAGNVRIGARALRDWCQGLGLPYVKPVSRVDGAQSPAAIKGGVYIKYNAKSKLCYVSAYESRDKGVLVQMAQEQLGHFPLGLFDEAMKNPEPEL